MRSKGSGGGIGKRVRTRARELALRGGYDVRRFDSGRTMMARRLRVIESAGIDLVLDVGANRGQWGGEIRAAGFDGPIVSLEPLAEPFTELIMRSDKDADWSCRRLGLGEVTGTAAINVAGNIVSSSMLPMTERHLSGAPGSATIGTEEVSIARLDEVASSLLAESENVYLKLDVQGYELHAMRGAEETLHRIGAIETELSLVELYEGQPLLPEVYEHLHGRGYDCVGLEQGFTDRETGYMLQADGLFLRRAPAAQSA